MYWMVNETWNTINGYAWGTPEHKRYARQANKDVQKALKELGLFDTLYTLLLDEPTEDEYDYVIQMHDFAHEDAPDLNILLTEQVEDKLIGHVNTWCPIIYNYDKDKMAERIKYNNNNNTHKR